LDLATGGAPQSLPSHRVQAINKKYADQKRQHQIAIDAAGPKLQQIKAAVDAKYLALDQQIMIKANAVRLDYKTPRAATDTEVAKAVAELQRLESNAIDAERKLAQYENVSLRRYLRA
jgi:hypothetical protein